MKTVLLLVLLTVVGIALSTFFVGTVLKGQVISPFSSITDTPVDVNSPTEVRPTNSNVRFIDTDLQTGWMPWIIKQVSILIGALSLIVFFYAGVNLIINGDNEEEFTKSIKMIIYGIVGIALAAFSYTIVANILALF